MKHFVEGLRQKGTWQPGETPWFVKGAVIFSSPDADLTLAAHTNQKVTVVELVEDEANAAYIKRNRGLQKRHEHDALLSYRIRFADGTRRQIRHLVETFDKGLAFTKRQLGTEYQLTLRPIDGETREAAFGPGFEYQVDWTGSQVDLVSAFDRTKVVGRPIVYLVVDTRTSVIAGFHVTFESPGWNTCRFALFHAFTNKVEFCRRLGIPIKQEDWPVEGLPLRILGDRGELLGEQGERLVESGLGCKLVLSR